MSTNSASWLKGREAGLQTTLAKVPPSLARRFGLAAIALVSTIGSTPLPDSGPAQPDVERETSPGGFRWFPLNPPPPLASTRGFKEKPDV